MSSVTKMFASALVAFLHAGARLPRPTQFGSSMAHRDRKAYQAKYYIEHKPERDRCASEWRKNNKEKCVEYTKRYQSKHPSKQKEYDAKRYATNKNAMKDKYSRWASKNKDKICAYARNRRAKKRNALGTHSASDIKTLLSILGNACLMCGAAERIAIDHIIPLDVGGSNGPTNLQPLCMKCNSSKRTTTADHRTKKQIRQITDAFQASLFKE